MLCTWTGAPRHTQDRRARVGLCVTHSVRRGYGRVTAGRALTPSTPAIAPAHTADRSTRWVEWLLLSQGPSLVEAVPERVPFICKAQDRRCGDGSRGRARPRSQAAAQTGKGPRMIGVHTRPGTGRHPDTHLSVYTRMCFGPFLAKQLVLGAAGGWGCVPVGRQQPASKCAEQIIEGWQKHDNGGHPSENLGGGETDTTGSGPGCWGPCGAWSRETMDRTLGRMDSRLRL